jgi:t-SNARE complex subunit (syntaxin)
MSSDQQLEDVLQRLRYQTCLNHCLASKMLGQEINLDNDKVWNSLTQEQRDSALDSVKNIESIRRTRIKATIRDWGIISLLTIFIAILVFFL